ncbi:MAG: hypothetical protein WA614_12365 [Acidimicrobiales bacterium]
MSLDIETFDFGAPQPSPLTSTQRFPDGGSYRIEIPSVEGPAVLSAVFAEADELQVPIHRVSQGSGVMMLTDGEITTMVERCAERGVMLCLFLGPRASWDVGAQRFTIGTVGTRARGRSAVDACTMEAQRACALGVRSLLVADEGVLWYLSSLRTRGSLPADLELKVSVMIAPANPVSFRLLERLGADTINVPSDLTIAQLAELRGTSATTIDFYVEAPDNIGGFVRLYDVAELVRVASPIYLKFGLRNAPDIYPSGHHLEQVAILSARERVRRARLALDLLERLDPNAVMSVIGALSQPSGERFIT